MFSWLDHLFEDGEAEAQASSSAPAPADAKKVKIQLSTTGYAGTSHATAKTGTSKSNGDQGQQEGDADAWYMQPFHWFASMTASAPAAAGAPAPAPAMEGFSFSRLSHAFAPAAAPAVEEKPPEWNPFAHAFAWKPPPIPPPTRPKSEAPEDDGTFDNYMSRADYGRIIQMDANLQQANQVRQERSEHKRFVQHQKQLFKQRGQLLRAERLQTQDSVIAASNACRQSAHQIGETARQQQMALRYKRDLQQEAWETHGRELTEKYSTRGNQEHVRQLKREIADEKARVGTELRNFLKQAKKDTDDGIHQVNTERVRRVYAETAHPVVRRSKQTVVARRWDRADDVRAGVAAWKREISANNDSYLERARQLNENSKKPSDSAALQQKRHEERVAYARQQTQWRKDIIAQREAVQERVRLENRDVHDKIDLASLISEKVVAHSILSGKGEVTEGSEDALATFSRFFGFKRTLREKDGSAFEL